MLRNAALVGSAIIVLIALTYWIGWRSQVIRVPGEPRPRRVVEEEERVEADLATARELYQQLQMLPVSEVHSLQELDHAIGTLIAADALKLVNDRKPAYRPEKLMDLRNDVVGIVYHRWIRPSFDEYDRFMTEAGYVLPETYIEITDGRKDSMRLSYPIWIGEPFDPEMRPREVLQKLWHAPPPSPGAGQAQHLQALSIDEEGIEVAAGPYCLTSERCPPLGGRLGEVGWHGGREITIPRYWQPRSGWPDDLLRRGQCVEHASVGIVLRFENGSVLPFRFDCWYDESSARWWVYSIAMNNVEGFFGGVFF
ncbi:MAG: hypothetical protein KJZ65_05160 [Phycisphaerales bacterium]|nr:hypothetical protein [Phycisphaerales bacterium]